MLWFILCIAILNMGAGFGLAVYLAQHAAGVAECPTAVPPELEAPEDSGAVPAATLEPHGTLEDPGEPPQGMTESVGADTDGEPSVSDMEEAPANSSRPSVMADLDAAVSEALGNIDLAESEAAPPLGGECADATPETALVKFHTQLEAFCEELVAFDNQLRSNAPKDIDELRMQLDSVAEASQKQEEVCDAAEQSLRMMLTNESLDEKRGELMIAAIQERHAAAAQAAETFDQIDPAADVAGECQMVLDQTASWIDTNHRLRDSVCDMISATQPADGEVADQREIDPLTEIMRRSAFDAILAEHWKKDPQHVRSLTLTVIDFDHFARLNRDHSPALGNRILREIAKLLRNELPDQCHVARFAGQAFAVLGIDHDLKQAVGDAERIRQTLEMLHMEYGEKDVQTTVSCGVVTATTADTQESLYTRAIESVQEAKRYGRNRTFVYEGEYLTPVVPPNLALNERHVAL